MGYFRHILLLTFISVSGLLELKAQDIHYSQYDLSPLNLNPANTGMFDGTYRLNSSYRTQWRSVTVPYTTFTLAADALHPFQKKDFAVGLLVNHDIAGDSRFKTFQFNLTGNYFLPIKDSTLKIGIGLLAGITNRNLSYDALYFDNQYDGTAYVPSLSTGESFSRESRTYMNLQLGASLYKQLSKRNFIHGGIALSNITKPKQSYFDVTTIQLDRRFNIYTAVNYALNDQFELIPSFSLQFQGKYSELVIGSQLRYILVNEKGVYRAIRAGLAYRTVDAGFLSVGIDYDKWIAGISYDINVSDLIPASNARGALEFSIIYIIDVFNPKLIQHRICPNYI